MTNLEVATQGPAARKHHGTIGQPLTLNEDGRVGELDANGEAARRDVPHLAGKQPGLRMAEVHGGVLGRADADPVARPALVVVKDMRKG